MFKLSLRELFLLTTLAAVGIGWGLDRSRLAAGPEWRAFDEYKAECWANIQVHIDDIEKRERELGLVLPAPGSYNDDVQYFPPGPEFPLSNEAAAQKAHKAEEEARLR